MGVSKAPPKEGVLALSMWICRQILNYGQGIFEGMKVLPPIRSEPLRQHQTFVGEIGAARPTEQRRAELSSSGPR